VSWIVGSRVLDDVEPRGLLETKRDGSVYGALLLQTCGYLRVLPDGPLLWICLPQRSCFLTHCDVPDIWVRIRCVIPAAWSHLATHGTKAYAQPHIAASDQRPKFARAFVPSVRRGDVDFFPRRKPRDNRSLSVVDAMTDVLFADAISSKSGGALESMSRAYNKHLQKLKQARAVICILNRNREAAALRCSVTFKQATRDRADRCKALRETFF